MTPIQQRFHDHNRLICKYLFLDIEAEEINPTLNVHDVKYTKIIKK
jgi:hypothetical protein